MGKKRSWNGKYNKISTQMKYSLVRLVQSNGMNLLTVSSVPYLDIQIDANQLLYC
jgi:hypothetical protein